MSGAPRGVVLLGFPRSGTTLVARLLDAHPQISAPPETYLMSAAARFLHEQDRVEGPPIGVLSGLEFVGIGAEEVHERLRRLVVGFHEQIAGDAQVWVEKTAVDVFHLETLETLLAGHVRFIVLTRHPLDVIASNLGLATLMGAQLADLFAMTKDVNSPHEGLALAWADRARALRTFAQRHQAACIRIGYEDLTHEPARVLGRLLEFLEVSGSAEDVIREAFATPPRIGLGDTNFTSTTGIVPAKDRGWRSRIPPAALARILPILAEEMSAAGYDVPRAPRIPGREEAVRQLGLAAALHRDRSRSDAASS